MKVQLHSGAAIVHVDSVERLCCAKWNGTLITVIDYTCLQIESCFVADLLSFLIICWYFFNVKKKKNCSKIYWLLKSLGGINNDSNIYTLLPSCGKDHQLHPNDSHYAPCVFAVSMATAFSYLAQVRASQGKQQNSRAVGRKRSKHEQLLLPVRVSLPKETI